MGLGAIERDRVAETVAANKKFFWVSCLAGLFLVSAGTLSLRTDKTIVAAGVVMADEESHLFAPADGILERHFVEIGQTVEAGDPLFSLSGDDLDLRILEKKQQLLEARGRRAALNDREQESLVQQQADLLELLENQVKVLERRRENLNVTAPISGAVVDIYRRNAGVAVAEGDPVLKIANTEGGYRVKALVGQRNVDLLRSGSPVRMESQVFDSMFDGYITGRVQRILAEPDGGDGEDPEGPSYEVTIEVEETPYSLVLGSRMKVEFLLGRHSLLELVMNRPQNDRAPRAAEEGE